MLEVSVADLSLATQIPLLGFDSFVAGVLVGPVLKSFWRRAGLAMLFGLCDGAGTLAGSLVPHVVPELSEVVVYAFVAIAVALSANKGSQWIPIVPLIMALDNFATGTPGSGAFALAISSGIAAWVGMALAASAWRGGQFVLTCFSSLPAQRARPHG
jgi:hypothetical protein